MKSLLVALSLILLCSCASHVATSYVYPPVTAEPLTWQLVSLNPFVCTDLHWRSNDGRFDIAPAAPLPLMDVCGYGGQWYGVTWQLRQRIEHDTQWSKSIARGTVAELKVRAESVRRGQ